MIEEIYGGLHRGIKKILKRGGSGPGCRMISFDRGPVEADPKSSFINELSPVPEKLRLSDVYPVENTVQLNTFLLQKDSFTEKVRCSKKSLGCSETDAAELWAEFIRASRIPEGYRNAGLHFAGYIWNCEEWCLPSWIWTNAALVRMYCRLGMSNEAKSIADRLIGLQQPCGGWIVRNDYDAEGAVPVLAPNDSAYIANDACLELYRLTGGAAYLGAAVRCAEWIMETVRDDGMVYAGYDTRRNQWQAKYNIVDVGFTAGLFARLYECTGDVRYVSFLKRFARRYMELFYIPEKKGFATSLDANDRRMGGMFGRGQAWALEGMIPASRVLQDEKITSAVQNTVNLLLRTQKRHGGWPYNLSRPLMGIDCKATPVIACALMDWYGDHPGQTELRSSAEKAYRWCVRHTLPEGKGKGGIFSYTTEGAVVHHFYTWTAFVYGSSYAMELKKLLRKE